MLSNRIRNLAPPPRMVPLPVVCSAMFGITGSIGAIFLVAGMIFSLIFTNGVRPVDELRLAFSGTAARGTITRVIETNAEENESPVYEYEFVFTTRREQTVTGLSYSTGRRWSVESAVPVEYVPDDPSIARIRGMRLSEFSLWILFVLLFPAVGAALFGAAAVSGGRQVALLRSGQIADARVVSSRPTNMTVNNNPVLAFSYEIRTAAGEVFEGSTKALYNGRIGDEESEPVLYLPSHPKRSVLVDGISLRYPLDVDEQTGQWISREGYARTVLYLLTWAAVISLGGYAFLRAFM